MLKHITYTNPIYNVQDEATISELTAHHLLLSLAGSLYSYPTVPEDVQEITQNILSLPSPQDTQSLFTELMGFIHYAGWEKSIAKADLFLINMLTAFYLN